MKDPMELAIEVLLHDAGIEYRRDDADSGLDFYIPAFDVYIEVKQFHTDRIAEQMGRRRNVIAVQGVSSVTFLRSLLAGAEK